VAGNQKFPTQDKQQAKSSFLATDHDSCFQGSADKLSPRLDDNKSLDLGLQEMALDMQAQMVLDRTGDGVNGR
jgi:hypothetical protein